MNFNIFSKNPLNFSLNISKEELNYVIRYSSFVEEYYINHKINFTSEGSEQQIKEYKIRYESSLGNDTLDYKIRYDYNVEILDYYSTYRLRYESESMSTTYSIYKIRYESEGLETYEGKKIYRVYYENDGVSSTGLSYKIKYQIETYQTQTLEYKIVYSTEQTQDVMTTRTLVEDSNGNTHLLIGVYTKEEHTKVPYGIIHAIPNKLFLEYEPKNESVLNCVSDSHIAMWMSESLLEMSVSEPDTVVIDGVPVGWGYIQSHAYFKNIIQINYSNGEYAIVNNDPMNSHTIRLIPRKDNPDYRLPELFGNNSISVLPNNNVTFCLAKNMG